MPFRINDISENAVKRLYDNSGNYIQISEIFNRAFARIDQLEKEVEKLKQILHKRGV